MPAQWILEAKERALKARGGMVVITNTKAVDCPPYVAAVFGLKHDSPVVGWGTYSGGGAFWTDDECSGANAELLVHAREDILRLIGLIEDIENTLIEFRGKSIYSSPLLKDIL